MTAGSLSACGPQPQKAERPPVQAATAPEKPALKDLAETARTTGIFSTFAKAIDASDLTATFSSPEPKTVFVPEDSAFAKLPPAKLEKLLADKAELAKLLRYHVVPGRITAADMPSGESELTTLDGQTIKVKVDTGIHVNGVKVVQSHIETSNGIIHVIDGVLTPPSGKPPSTPAAQP